MDSAYWGDVAKGLQKDEYLMNLDFGLLGEGAAIVMRYMSER
jgi:hypothetical protein